jgi:hypothetical protein
VRLLAEERARHVRDAARWACAQALAAAARVEREVALGNVADVEPTPRECVVDLAGAIQAHQAWDNCSMPSQHRHAPFQGAHLIRRRVDKERLLALEGTGLLVPDAMACTQVARRPEALAAQALDGFMARSCLDAIAAAVRAEAGADVSVEVEADEIGEFLRVSW